MNHMRNVQGFIVGSSSARSTSATISRPVVGMRLRGLLRSAADRSDESSSLPLRFGSAYSSSSVEPPLSSAPRPGCFALAIALRHSRRGLGRLAQWRERLNRGGVSLVRDYAATTSLDQMGTYIPCIASKINRSGHFMSETTSWVLWALLAICGSGVGGRLLSVNVRGVYLCKYEADGCLSNARFLALATEEDLFPNPNRHALTERRNAGRRGLRTQVATRD
jgi:hypothetical protein